MQAKMNPTQISKVILSEKRDSTVKDRRKNGWHGAAMRCLLQCIHTFFYVSMYGYSSLVNLHFFFLYLNRSDVYLTSAIHEHRNGMLLTLKAICTSIIYIYIYIYILYKIIEFSRLA